MDLSIIPECYVDTNLIETVAPPQGRYNHQKGCGTVTKVMQEHFANGFALGIIDKDKKELDYLKEFNVVVAKGNLELQKHKTKNHFIIRITPAIEEFILANVEIAGINLADFNLSSDFNEFKKETKTANSKSDVRFKRLFWRMSQLNLADFQLLRNWIQYLKTHPYNNDIEALKAM